jgi:hypothetical protein
MSHEITPEHSAAPPAEAAPAPRPLWARSLALVTAPRAVFEELRPRPSWFWPAVLLAATTLVFGWVTFEPLLYPMMVEKVENSDMTPERAEAALAMYENPGMKAFMLVTGTIFSFALVPIFGLVLFGVCSFLLGGRATVRQSMSVAAHAALVLIPRSVLLLPLLFARQDPTLSLGPGALMPPSEATGFLGRFVAIFLSGCLDLFHLWGLGLAIVGMSVMAHLGTRTVAVALIAAYVGLGILGALMGAFQQ